jgi:hypothetical protein
LTILLEIQQVLDAKLNKTNTRLRSFFKEQVSESDNRALIRAAENAAGPSQTPPKAVQLRPWKYALFKEKLDGSVDDLEAWQKIFDPSWYLIIRAAHNTPVQEKIDAEVARPRVTPTAEEGSAKRTSELLQVAPRRMLEAAKPHVFLPEDGFGAMTKQEVEASTVAVGFRGGTQRNRPYILETFASPPNARSDIVAKNVRDVAIQLTQMEPQTSGLLRCKGVVRHKRGEGASAPSFTFVFHVPEGSGEPQSLRHVLVSGGGVHSLSERFRLATELAKAVSFVHVVGFVHKNIRPETVLLLRNDSSSLGSAYLVGFERVRNADGHTFRLGTASWQKDLYHHPTRQGLVPEEAFMMQHDIYSLGVCLLELGLWQSLIDTQPNQPDRPSEALRLPSADRTAAVPQWNSGEMKEHLVDLAQKDLPQRMGTKYAEVVVTCLTCLDRGNLDFGDEEEFQDEDGIVVGVRFIEKASSRVIAHNKS